MSSASSPAPKLTDAQLVLLSAASQREDGLVVLTDAHPSVARTITALLHKELLTELVVQRLQPHWRQDNNGKPIGLKLTRRGYAAIGADFPAPSDAGTAPLVPPTIDTIRPGTKQTMMIALLTGANGASVEDLMAATGWLPHTTRAVLSGLRKKGFEVASDKPEGAERRYSIAAVALVSAA